MPDIALILGTAISKSLVRAWLKRNDITADMGTTVLDILSGHLSDRRSERRAQRVFERVADDIAGRLEPFMLGELRDLADNEREAAATAVATALARARLTDDDFFQCNLEASLLESLVQQRAGSILDDSLLSPAGRSFYGRLLGEACAHLVELRQTLPTFGTDAAVELLKRESDLAAQLAEIVSRLPPAAALSAEPDDDAVFLVKYQRVVAQRLDELELYGLDLPTSSRRYRLSVAYITLAARIPSGSTGDVNETDAIDDADSDEAAYVRVDELLSSAKHLLVRGEAGSGKTTLLHWLAVQSARRSFTGHLTDWNATVPFFVQLRSLDPERLPSPEDFLNPVARNLRGQMPDGWVHRILEAQQALLLIDGVDEVPSEHRPLVRKWVRALIEDYPGNRVVITSRPPAIDDQWYGGFSLDVAELQPMTPADINAFIEHWHVAASHGVQDPALRVELSSLKEHLLRTVRDSHTIRALATSPLLCAMLCALNRVRRRQLPRDRLELYRIALEMLLDRRDQERNVPEAYEWELSLPQKQVLLQELAYWLMANGRGEASRAEAERCFDRRILGMQLGPTATSRAVYDYLIVRSGLLREPAIDRVDFVHRTFQEYLAGLELLERDMIDFLLGRAHEDQWWEVVILTTGSARPTERARLVEGLVERGRRDPLQRHRLHLLAVACLETARELPPGLREEVRSLLASLIPPQNMSEARAVASAGDLAVPLLAAVGRVRALTAAACVRSLALIGTPLALDALANFAPDARVTVAREVIRAWQYFEPEPYAEKVLSHCPLEHGAFHLSDTVRAPALLHLRHLEQLSVDVPIGVESLDYLSHVSDRIVALASNSPVLWDLHALRSAHQLKRLHLRNNDQLLDLGDLAGLALENVGLYSCRAVVDISGLATQPIESISLLGCSSLSDITPLGSLSQCRSLDLEGTSVVDLGPVGEMVLLEALDISTLGIRSVGPLSALEHLTTLNANDLLPGLDHSSLSSLHALTELHMQGAVDVDSLASIGPIPSLQELDVRESSLRQLRGIEGFPRLRALDVSGTTVSDLAPLEGRPLEKLQAAGCSGVTSLEPIVQCPISMLEITDASVGDWELLLEMRTLRRLHVDARCPPGVLKVLRDRGVRVRRSPFSLFASRNLRVVRVNVLSLARHSLS